MFHQSKTYKVFWLISVVFLIVGFILMHQKETDYSTSNYWVAKDFHHVYEKYSGEIVNIIEKNETCKIKDDVIIVSTKTCGEWGYHFGRIIAIFSGIGIAYLIFIFFKEAWYDQRK